MGLQELAEGIILQSIEDLWSEDLSEECVDFFKGKEFRICAEISRMALIDQVTLLNMIKGVVEYRKKKTALKRSDHFRKGNPCRPPELTTTVSVW